jgi:hypothetical protein
MSAIWDLRHKYEIWLEVELQACAAFEWAGQIPRGTSAKIRKKAKIDVARIAEIEKRVAQIDRELADNWADQRKCQQLGAERQKLASELEPLEYEYFNRQK